MSSEHTNLFRDLHAFGLSVIPMETGKKKPAISKWQRFCTARPTEADLCSWENRYSNVGVACGAASGVVVVDIDTPEAQAFMDGLNLPPTPTVKTAKGHHLYFRLPAMELTNRVRVAGFGFDVRASGGCVMGAGSVHPDGPVYQWVVSPADIPFADMPANLLDLLKPQAKLAAKRLRTGRSVESAVPSGESHPMRYLQVALAEACQRVREVGEGARNQTLFAVAVRFAEHVATLGADWVEQTEELIEAALAAGLEDSEITSTLDSAWKSGQHNVTAWLQIAAEHIHLAASNRFYHIGSSSTLNLDGFNGHYGHVNPTRGTFASYLLNGGFVRKVYDFAYDPNAKPGFFMQGGVSMFNTYRPSSIQSVSGDARPFLDFVSYLVPEQSERQHLLNVIAHSIRYPGKRLRHAVLMRSKAQGIGKSMLVAIWGELMGHTNVRKVASKEMSGNFQPWIKENTLLVCEEMDLGHGSYNFLKDLITGDTFTVNEKYLAPRDWPVFSTIVMLTNLDTPLRVEDSDRRIFFVDSPALPRKPNYYTTFATWWQENLGVIRGFLDTVDLTDFKPFAPAPMTFAKQMLIRDSKSVLAQDLQFCIEQGTGLFQRDIVTLDDLSTAFQGRQLRSVRELGTALEAVGGAKLGQQAVRGRRESLWAIRNSQRWLAASNEQRAAEYTKATAMQSA